MKLYRIFQFAGLAYGLSIHAVKAADPQWWADQGVKSGSQASNLSPATIGQAKHMVKMALAELEPPKLPQATYNAIQSDLAAIVDLTPPQNQAGFDDQRKVLLNGQLKALAKPFYDRLRSLNPAWIEEQMSLHGLQRIEPGSNPYSFSPYPWSVVADDDSNLSPATLGQLKAVFSIDFSLWGVVQNPDSDSDGISDVVEEASGTSPVLLDTDGDGHFDPVDAFPLDPTKWDPLSSVSGDTAPPLVALETPKSAVLVTGP